MKPFRVASGRRVLKSGHKDGLAGLQPHAEAFWDTFFVSFCAAGDRLQNAQRSAPAVPTDVAKIARKSFLRQFVSFLSISGFLLRRARSEIKAGAKKTVFDFYSALARYEIQEHLLPPRLSRFWSPRCRKHEKRDKSKGTIQGVSPVALILVQFRQTAAGMLRRPKGVFL